MASTRPTSTSYANRQVDVELLQSIKTPDISQRVSISNVRSAPKFVAGLEKMAQRYTSLLLAYRGSTHFDTSEGTDFLGRLLGGFQNMGSLQSEFALANSEVMAQLKKEDVNPDYGAIPDDERITNAVLVDTVLDTGTATALLRVQLTSVAGDSAVFIIPATSAR